MDMLSIADICNTQLLGENIEIKQFVTDSRTLFSCEDVIFCAIKGLSFDGHKYIPELARRGIKAFIVENDELVKDCDVSYIVVKSTIAELQKIAGVYRTQMRGEVTAIVGSNGKSIVKEWISQLVAVEKSPKSYNSQLGVALSVLGVPNDSDYYVFEAGISQCGEMQHLEAILKPDSVIFTNLSDAHSENFESKDVKLEEKLYLAKDCKRIIYNTEKAFVSDYIEANFKDKRLFCWGEKEYCDIKILAKEKIEGAVHVRFSFGDDIYMLNIPFNDSISYYNVMTSLSYIAMTHSKEVFAASVRKCESLEAVEMRMEIKDGNRGAVIINDVYNSDFKSLSIALDTLNSNCKALEKVVVLSDIQQSYLDNEVLYRNVADLLMQKGVDSFYGVGEALLGEKASFKGFKNSKFFATTEDLLSEISESETLENEFSGKAILLKGSRKFKFEKISATIERQVHTTVLEVNLSQLLDNYLYLKSQLKPNTKCMAMVKADAYGCGAVEVARNLEKQGLDYLAVAYADEGVKLRDGGVKLPIIVLNSEPHAYKTMIKYRLEPEIYSFKSLEKFSNEVKHTLGVSYPIHLKLDTGMHRLGFEEGDLPQLIDKLKENKWVKVKSIFSHFTSSDNESHDVYTQRQIELYKRMSSKIIDELSLQDVIRHLANSAGIERFKDAEFDMVRMGISLYCSSKENSHIKDILTLKTVIAQIHSVSSSETVGYNKNQTLKTNSRIATIPIGYADGFRRALSCGAWSVEVNGQLAPTVGNVCMDACMIDVTDIDCAEGDVVTIVGKNNTVNSMAERIQTISYEIITLISPRVKRVYFRE